jgi:LPXTG-site transpeptidase (sortase) family protein
MRPLLTAAGALLLSLGLAGLILLGVGPRRAIQLEATRLAVRLGLLTAPPPQLLTPLAADEVQALTQLPAPIVDGVPTTAGVVVRTYAPPGRLRIPSIRLDSEVVPARLVRLGATGNAVTWEVPAHRVGHAQGTAGAGDQGNSVLLGHVSSVNAGNVFALLERVQVGDEVVVEGDGAYTYRVSEIERVPRDDLSVMAPSDGATLTLLTCTGAWLPDALDYSHRLAVRAVLEP